ncbi:39S ribosomal protein L45, mitochondrial [Balamuthia mandrillaris]
MKTAVTTLRSGGFSGGGGLLCAPLWNGSFGVAPSRSFASSSSSWGKKMMLAGPTRSGSIAARSNWVSPHRFALHAATQGSIFGASSASAVSSSPSFSFYSTSFSSASSSSLPSSSSYSSSASATRLHSLPSLPQHTDLSVHPRHHNHKIRPRDNGFGLALIRRKGGVRRMVIKQAMPAPTARRPAAPPIYIPGAGEVVEPHLAPRGLALLHPKKLYNRLMSWLRTVQGLRMLKRAFRQQDRVFKIATFRSEAEDIFLRFCKARASGDVKELKDLCTENLFPTIKSSLLQNKGNVKVDWAHDPSKFSSKLLRVRWIETSAETITLAFAQLVVQFNISQRLAVYNTAGERVAGSESMTLAKEYWVFERDVQNLRSSTWRLVGKIDPSAQPTVSAKAEEQPLKDESATNAAAAEAPPPKRSVRG